MAPAAASSSGSSVASDGSSSVSSPSKSLSESPPPPPAGGGKKRKRRAVKIVDDDCKEKVIEVLVPGFFPRPWDVASSAKIARARLDGEEKKGSADNAALVGERSSSLPAIKWNRGLTWALGPKEDLCRPLQSASVGNVKTKRGIVRIAVKVCGKTGKAVCLGTVEGERRMCESLTDMHFSRAGVVDGADSAPSFRVKSRPKNGGMDRVAAELFGRDDFVSLGGRSSGDEGIPAEALQSGELMSTQACAPFLAQSAFLPSLALKQLMSRPPLASFRTKAPSAPTAVAEEEEEEEE